MNYNVFGGTLNLSQLSCGSCKWVAFTNVCCWHFYWILLHAELFRMFIVCNITNFKFENPFIFLELVWVSGDTVGWVTGMSSDTVENICVSFHKSCFHRIVGGREYVLEDG